MKTGRFEIHVNTMEQNWINYKIFVSSTFRDMDFERDVMDYTGADIRMHVYDDHIVIQTA